MRSSQWDVLQRCLRILALLQRGPASKQTLLTANYEGSDSAVSKQFENDLARLRDHFHVDIQFDHKDKVYRLHDIGNLPLFDLPPDALEGINFLLRTFTPASPHYRQIQILLEALKLRLPSDQLERLSQDAVSTLDLRRVDTDRIPDAIFQKLERAYRERRKVEFEYRSPQRSDESNVRHVVWTSLPRFNAMRGHYYMRAYCEYTYSAQWGERRPQQFILYRLGRIMPETLQVLPSRFGAFIPKVPEHDVIYWLAPRIARYGVSERFDDMQVEQHDDGSATVYAKTDDLFTAARSLLFYGPNCRVLGGEELLAEFKDIVLTMARQYSDET